MADVKISGLTDGGSLQVGDEVPVARGSANRKITGDDFPCILARQARVTVVNTTTETTVATGVIPGGQLGTGNMVEWRLGGTFESTGNTLANGGILRLYYGGLNLYEGTQSLTGSFVTSPYTLEVSLVAVGSVSAQQMFGEYVVNTITAVSVGLGQMLSDEIAVAAPIAGISAGIDSLTDQSFTVTWQWATADTSVKFVCFGGTMTRY